MQVQGYIVVVSKTNRLRSSSTSYRRVACPQIVDLQLRRDRIAILYIIDPCDVVAAALNHVRGRRLPPAAPSVSITARRYEPRRATTMNRSRPFFNGRVVSKRNNNNNYQTHSRPVALFVFVLGH